MARSSRFAVLWRVMVRVVATFLLVAALTLAGLYAYAGPCGFNVILRRGASVGVAVTADDPRLSASMRRHDRSVAPAPEKLTHGFCPDRVYVEPRSSPRCRSPSAATRRTILPA